MTVLKEVNKSNKGHTHYQWLIAVAANLSLLTYGLQIGWVSPMTVILQSESSPTGYALSPTAISWVGSTMSLAACFGVPIFSYIADNYGRKVGVLLLPWPQVLSWALKLSSANTITIIIARILAGISAGGSYAIVPMYVKEISQDNIRGLLGSLITLVQNIGVLSMYLLGAYLGYFKTTYCVIWIPVLAFLLLLKAPESPAYLMKIGKVDEASAVIAFLRGLNKDDEDVIKEINNLQREDQYIKSMPSLSLLSILKNGVWRRIFFITIAMMTTHACNGSFTITTYASLVLINSGSNINPELQSLSFPLICIIASFIAMNCVERFGRKPLLGTCFAMLAASMTCIATVSLIQHYGGTVPYWIPLTAMMMAVAGHSGGPSPVPFVILSEIYNFQIRAKMIGCNVCYAWFMNFAQLFIYAPISSGLGPYTIFFIFAGINIISIYISLIVLPETKGKNVEEIEEDIRQKYKLKN